MFQPASLRRTAWLALFALLLGQGASALVHAAAAGGAFAAGLLAEVCTTGADRRDRTPLRQDAPAGPCGSCAACVAGGNDGPAPSRFAAALVPPPGRQPERASIGSPVRVTSAWPATRSRAPPAFA